MEIIFPTSIVAMKCDGFCIKREMILFLSNILLKKESLFTIRPLINISIRNLLQDIKAISTPEKKKLSIMVHKTIVIFIIASLFLDTVLV